MSDHPWRALKRFTAARVALGRTGVSLPTTALLEFQLACAQARDAVHAQFESGRLCREFEELGFETAIVASAARDRAEYLLRPDAGRRLATGQELPAGEAPELAMVVADGLSAPAVNLHATAMLAAIKAKLTGWKIGPVILAQQARVAIGDEIGERLGASFVVVLIGERPGLTAPDSLGAYLTFRPRIGRTDAERNCLSNIRPAGLPYDLAAYRLAFLLESAWRLQLTGVALKDLSASAAISLSE